VMDITELKQAQSALRQSEDRFHTIFDSVNDLIFVHDFEKGNFVEINQRACEMFGYTRDELLKLKIGDLSENKPPLHAPEPVVRDAKGAIRDAANVRLAG
jgi:PAS domain S-box-containing protein